MIPRRSAAVLPLCFLTIAACEKEQPGDAGQPACQPGPMEVEVGTGQTSFVSIPGGEDLPFYMGPQGGFHVWGSVRARGYTPAASNDPNDLDHPVVRFTLQRGSEAVAGTSPLHWNLAPVGDGWREKTGAFVIFSAPSPLALEGEAVSLQVQLTDRCALVGTDTRGGLLRFDGPAPGPGGGG
jgi:hypothetical protein